MLPYLQIPRPQSTTYISADADVYPIDEKTLSLELHTIKQEASSPLKGQLFQIIAILRGVSCWDLVALFGVWRTSSAWETELWELHSWKPIASQNLLHFHGNLPQRAGPEARTVRCSGRLVRDCSQIKEPHCWSHVTLIAPHHHHYCLCVMLTAPRHQVASSSFLLISCQGHFKVSNSQVCDCQRGCLDSDKSRRLLCLSRRLFFWGSFMLSQGMSTCCHMKELPQMRYAPWGYGHSLALNFASLHLSLPRYPQLLTMSQIQRCKVEFICWVSDRLP